MIQKSVSATELLDNKVSVNRIKNGVEIASEIKPKEAQAMEDLNPIWQQLQWSPVSDKKQSIQSVNNTDEPTAEDIEKLTRLHSKGTAEQKNLFE